METLETYLNLLKPTEWIFFFFQTRLCVNELTKFWFTLHTEMWVLSNNFHKFLLNSFIVLALSKIAWWKVYIIISKAKCLVVVYTTYNNSFSLNYTFNNKKKQLFVGLFDIFWNKPRNIITGFCNLSPSLFLSAIITLHPLHWESECNVRGPTLTPRHPHKVTHPAMSYGCSFISVATTYIPRATGGTAIKHLSS